MEAVVTIRASICGTHHDDACTGCKGSLALNDSLLEQDRARIKDLEQLLRYIANSSGDPEHPAYVSASAMRVLASDALALSCQAANDGSER